MKSAGSILTALLFCLLLFTGSVVIAATDTAGKAPGVTLYYFWGVGCPHCAEAKPFLEELQRRYPALRIESWEVLENRANIPRLMEMSEARNHKASGVPTFIIGDRVVSGFATGSAVEIEGLVQASLAAAGTGQHPAGDPEVVHIPLVGRIDPARASLPVFTAIIAALDSFNPCAFFVLFFLLSLLVHDPLAQPHAADRRRLRAVLGAGLLRVHRHIQEGHQAAPTPPLRLKRVRGGLLGEHKVRPYDGERATGVAQGEETTRPGAHRSAL